jgi:hypothetical protein
MNKMANPRLDATLSALARLPAPSDNQMLHGRP